MAGAKKKTDSGTMTFIVASLLLTLVGAGTGFAVGAFLLNSVPEEPVAPAPQSVAVAPPHEGEDNTGHATSATQDESHAGSTEKASGEEQPEEETEDPHAVKVVAFPPVLTTLAEPKGKWIRLEGSILALLETEDPPELLAERSAEQILTYLRSVRLEEIEGPTGILALRQDLNEMVQALSNGQVRGVLMHGLLVE